MFWFTHTYTNRFLGHSFWFTVETMNFQIVEHFQVPVTCRKMILEFLREPHPTAVLIKKLRFGTRESTREPGQFWMTVEGEGVQYKDPDCNTLSDGGWRTNVPPPILVFKYNNCTGEPLYALDLDVWERDDSDAGNSDSDDSDGANSNFAALLNGAEYIWLGNDSDDND